MSLESFLKKVKVRAQLSQWLAALWPAALATMSANDTEEAAAVLKLQILTASESVDRPEGAPVPHQGLASDRLQSYQAELDSMSDSLKKCREAKIVPEIV